MSGVLPVTIHVDVEDTKAVIARLDSVGAHAERMGARMAAGTEFSMKAAFPASLMMNTAQLCEVVDRLQKAQMDAGRGLAMLRVTTVSAAGIMSFMSSLARPVDVGTMAGLTAKEEAAWLVTGLLLEKVSWGLAAPAIVAITAAARRAAASGMSCVPSRREGGRIYTSGLYRLHAGETVSRNNDIVIDIDGSGGPEAAARAVVYELKARGVI